MKTVRIAAAQTFEYLEDVEAALTCITDVAERAKAQGAALLCLPEGFLQGYLTDELTAKRSAFDLASADFQIILQCLPKDGPMIVFGMIEIDGGRLFNSAIVVSHGILVGRYRKVHLLRGEQCFEAGNDSGVFEVDGLRFGINICYDTNFPEAASRIADLGATLIVCPTNNMLSRKKAEAYKELHNEIRGNRCRETGLWLVSADVTGERSGQISYGPTAVLDPTGRVAAQLPLGETGLLVFDVPCSR
jgi:predicted amidohydrolase